MAPKLAKLSSTTEMSSYGVEQWKFLLHAGDVTAFVVEDDDDQHNNILGCVLRICYGTTTTTTTTTNNNNDDDDNVNANAYGMMLVSRQARGQGLARRLLLTSAMNMADESLSPLHILGTCHRNGTSVL